MHIHYSYVEDKMVKIEFVKSEENDADLFMKYLLGYLFEEHAKTSFYFMAAASGRKPGQLTALMWGFTIAFSMHCATTHGTQEHVSLPVLSKLNP